MMAIVEREWPDGVPVTRKNCLRAAELGLTAHWVYYKLLPAEAWAKHSRARYLARAAFDRVQTQTRAKFDRTCWMAIWSLVRQYGVRVK